jgi:hypothetical protein
LSRQYVQRVEFRGYVLGEWQPEATEQGARTPPRRWDVLDRPGQVVKTFSDRQHAESFVDHQAAVAVVRPGSHE